MQKVENGHVVKVHYTGRLTTGEIFDSSLGREPLEFTMGEGQMIPGFEQGILGMVVGEKKSIQVPCELGYGEVLEEMILEVPKSQLPLGMPMEVGTQLAINLANGGQIPAVMTAVSEETVTIDANHPLAGKDLVFEVQLVEINPKKSGLIFFE
ncbi:FKBP-type peptidyl-prolyl cis-trans isomerase [Raineya orbicola]|jgi:FKBP-type peptidyl-prolyl cis-trans isomerase 2|uniref:Peptidyl-prolyl cis-trans isomerase n=1 Tax=Raineya orbicola TaxID=2016530 RepID=A0A2N3IE44_9BACT|nr:peptidylprolyl isomerase [Raineya orbicola]PKQ68570.1 FKBP-type peptidyl-prolyl cis-trans isomerase 2 [Raineya orbicola]